MAPSINTSSLALPVTVSSAFAPRLLVTVATRSIVWQSPRGVEKLPESEEQHSCSHSTKVLNGPALKVDGGEFIGNCWHGIIEESLYNVVCGKLSVRRRKTSVNRCLSLPSPCCLTAILEGAVVICSGTSWSWPAWYSIFVCANPSARTLAV